MIAYELSVENPVQLVMTGKFVAPSPEWIHLNRFLLDFELIVMTHGTLYIAGDKDHFVLNKGDYLLQAPLTNQYGYKSSDCSFYWLHFTTKNEMIPRNIEEDDSPPRVEGKVVIPQQGTLTSPEKIIVIMKQLQDSIRCYNEKTLNDYMSTVILCELYNQLFPAKKDFDKTSKQMQLYNDIVDHIKWFRYENLKVSDVADYFGYNEKYLSHLFTTLSGVSLKQFILQQKMEAAKFILSDTNQNINEVSMRLGYQDSHHFMKSFKKFVGLTPTEYRNAYSKRLLYYE
ncbi:helix-turn-helix domain-containing protein [Gorillibacterium massiliense]|uniref:helix-turn-helix domain-containing protein n=1 Tax=Gorillibacterium massiliense TaxID=1280390 RepID=UPI000592647F|nr:AraC family transcriptional regulator [Gorillibacterium massiliense]